MRSRRCGPCSGHPLLEHHDSLLRKGLYSILNLSLTEGQWLQASLPVKVGSLGIRRLTSLALPAPLASTANTLAQQSSMLSDINTEIIDTQFTASFEQWCIKYPTSCPDGELSHKQSFWDKNVIIANAITELNRLHTMHV